MFDIAHKVISPSTYQCALCSLTHNALSEKSEWADFRKSSRHDLQFLHKNEFEAQYSTRFDYPVILDITGEMKTLFSNLELAEFKNVKDLIAGIEKAAT
ncbi:MAG: GTPase [Nitrosomonadales bacterium]|nr:GTPase [Nitrosomonadales bacterium]